MPLIPPYDNSAQTMKFSIGGLEDPLYTDLSTMKCVGRIQVIHEGEDSKDQNNTPLVPWPIVSRDTAMCTGIFTTRNQKISGPACRRITTCKR